METTRLLPQKCPIWFQLDFFIPLSNGIHCLKSHAETYDLMTKLITLSNDDNFDDDTAVVTKTKPKTAKPPMYKVLLLNDDYTPMEFVVHVLERFFTINHQGAIEIMMTVHKKGAAVVGVFSHDIAETKVTQVMDLARKHEHPLQCTMEKE